MTSSLSNEITRIKKVRPWERDRLIRHCINGSERSSLRNDATLRLFSDLSESGSPCDKDHYYDCEIERDAGNRENIENDA